MKNRELYLVKKALKDYRHWICIIITAISLSLSIFYFKYALPRIWECCIDIGTSAKFYISELFDLNLNGELTVKQFTEQPFRIPFGLPATWEEFKTGAKLFWDRLFTKENFLNYITFLVNLLLYLSKFLMILMPVTVTVIISKKLKKPVANNDYNKDSLPLRSWRILIEKKIYTPMVTWIKNFIKFISENKYYLQIWGFIWLYNFNGIAILLDFIAFALYFCASFRFIDVYTHVVKILMDLSVCIDFVLGIIWAIFGIVIFDILRKKIGYKNLENKEKRNREFIEERPIVCMINGTMGTGKTTMITDMALSQEILFRDKALELMQKADLKFPNFPWIKLELSIKRALQEHTVYSLSTMRKFIRGRRHYFELHQSQRNIFEYDFEYYGLYYNNKLYLENIWDVIETYAQLYLIYVTRSSLILSNYSIRSDNAFQDKGNFPIWENDLFCRSVQESKENSRFAHILDFDMLRLGKKVIEENNKANAFEFGVVVITEIGKERGNNLENIEMKKKDEFANAKNDLFNDWLKMIRHSATVDNFPFVKVIVDDQRPESWGADARDLCEIGIIEERSKKKLGMPFFFFEDLLISWKIRKGNLSYLEHRFERGDNTLKTHVFHGIDSKLWKFHSGIYNRFGYDKLTLKVEKGTQDGETKEKKYYLIDSKIRRKRFSTDCFSEVFEEKALRSDIGLNDLQCYVTDKATFKEMLLANSYFFKKLANIKSSNDNERI